MNTITTLREALTDKKISCAELTQLYLSAAERVNPELRAYTSFTEDEALCAANAVDKKIASGGELGPLEGIPFVLKDNLVTKDIKTTCASRMLADYIPNYDAAVWEYLKDGGAVMLGKGNMDEFAIGTTGETSILGAAMNPRDPARVAGGSSGGSASAVAAGAAAFGIGSDTGGSVRLPASYCGVYGLRPTYGAVSRFGLVAVASSFDQVGPVALCADDIAAVFAEICRRDERDMTSAGAEFSGIIPERSVRGFKIGIASEFMGGLPPEIESAVTDAMKTLEHAGAELVPVSFPLLDLCLPVYFVLACAEISSNMGRFDGLRFGHRAERYADIDDFVSRSRSEGFGLKARQRILFGTGMLSAGYFDDYYAKAIKLKNAVKNALSGIFDICDCLLTPTVPQTAPKAGASHGSGALGADKYTVPASLAGLPALSVPCGTCADGLPVGMQLIAPRFREDTLLRIAAAFEDETAHAFITEPDMGVRL